jgi:hypothetical protein
MAAHGTVRIRVPRWLGRLGLTAALDGRPVPLDEPVPVASTGGSVELRLSLAVAREGGAVRVCAHCSVPVVVGRETVVGRLR